MSGERGDVDAHHHGLVKGAIESSEQIGNGIRQVRLVPDEKHAFARFGRELVNDLHHITSWGKLVSYFEPTTSLTQASGDGYHFSGLHRTDEWARQNDDRLLSQLEQKPRHVTDPVPPGRT